MDQLPVSIATEEDEEKAGPIDQAPPDWTEGIDWTIPKSKATQKKFNKILYSYEYQQRKIYLNQKFHKELDAVKKLRKQKQLGYAKKANKRKPMSIQADRNNAKCIMCILTLPRYTKEHLLIHVRSVMDKYKALPFIEQEIESEETPLLHWQTPMSTMEIILKNRELLHEDLRVRTCSFDILNVVPTRYNTIVPIPATEIIKPPLRGTGKGSVANPTEVDQETGTLDASVLLLRTIGGPGNQNVGCDLRLDSDRCNVCRQKLIAADRLLPLSKVKQPRLWSARDKRGDRNIQKKIRVQEILDANTAVPCPRGAASSPIISPITKRTRSIYWGGVFAKNKEQHDDYLIQKKLENQRPNTGFEHIDARSVFLQDATDRKRASTAGRRRRRRRRKKKEGNPTLDSPTNVKRKKSKPKVSKSDHVLRILGDMDTLTMFSRDMPMSTIIKGSKDKLSTKKAQNITRQRINLITGTILLQQRKWRRNGMDPMDIYD